MEDADKCSAPSKTSSCRPNCSARNPNQHEGTRRGRNEHLICKMCGYKARHEIHLVDHMRTHTGERPFKCTVNDCGITFKSEYVLKNHVKYKHSDERPFKCKFPGCRHKAKIPTDLLKHNSVHSVERQFTCPLAGCNFNSKNRGGITCHVKRVHSLVKAFACSKCDYKTALKGNLKYHMRRHSNRRDFKCTYPQCDKSFKSSEYLKFHLSSQHGERKFQCDHPGCGRNYGSVLSLNKHKRYTHSQKTHTCPERGCSYSASRRSHLTSHMMTHKGTQRIPCSIEGCKYKGKNRKAMKDHTRCHKTLLPCPVSGCGRYAATKETLNQHVKFHNPSGRPFQCPLCFKHFRKLQELQTHCAAHTNEKPFTCGHCEYAAATKHTIKTHISLVHPKITYPFIAHPLNVRECLRCRVTSSFAEFVAHSMIHEVPVVILERVELIW